MNIASKPNSEVPFGFSGPFANVGLKLQACTKCRNDGPFGRGVLRQQQMGTIEFLVQKELMSQD